MKSLLECLSKEEREKVVITMPKGGFITQGVLANDPNNKTEKEDKKKE